MSLRFTESKTELESKKIWKVPTIIGFNDRPSENTKLQIACIIDTETTGLDTAKDEIIELGYMLIEFDHDGKFYNVLKRFNQLQQPSESLDPEITRITGITDADLEGHSIGWAEVEKDIATVDLCIAHNAQFDRKMLERYSDTFKSKSWACTVNDIDWASMGQKIRSQEWLLFKITNCYYEAHRALDDVNALSFLLSRAVPESTEPLFQQLITKAVEDQYVIKAQKSAFAEKDNLKAIGCRWNAEGKVWWLKATQANLDERKSEILAAAPSCELEIVVVPAIDRYSTRDM